MPDCYHNTTFILFTSLREYSYSGYIEEEAQRLLLSSYLGLALHLQSAVPAIQREGGGRENTVS